MDFILSNHPTRSKKAFFRSELLSLALMMACLFMLLHTKKIPFMQQVSVTFSPLASLTTNSQLSARTMNSLSPKCLGQHLSVLTFPELAQTRISYRLPEEADIEISVYNQQGVRLDTLLRGTRKRGIHTLTWHVADLPSGLYFVHFRGLHRQWVKKVHL